MPAKSASAGSGAEELSASGAYSTSIPIVVPRGANGVQPTLALRYSSGANRGNAGKGWSLSLPAITRSLHYGAFNAQRLALSEAQFSLSGQELIRDSKQERDPFGCLAQRYYTEVDNFKKILLCEGAWNTNALSYWVVVDQRGTRSTFGYRAAANSKLLGRGRAKNPVSGAYSTIGTAGYIYFLDEVTDVHGLSWRANYSAYGDGEPSATTAPRLLNVQYTFKNSAPLGDVRSVNITWEPRPDGRPESVSYAYGFALTYARRISAIQVNLGTAANARVRKYVLNYDAVPSQINEQLSPDSNASILASVKGFGVSDNDQAPPTHFEYQFSSGNNPFAAGGITVGSGDLLPKTVDNTCGDTIEDLFDINGDGYLDRVVKNGNHWDVYRGNGLDGFSAAAEQWHASNANLPRIRRFQPPSAENYRCQGATYGVEYDVSLLSTVADINGDGLPDIYEAGFWYRNNGTPGAASFERRPWSGAVLKPGERVRRQGWSAPTTYDCDSHGEWPFYDSCDYSIVKWRTKLIDGDNDGCADVYQADGFAWSFYHNKMCDKTPMEGFADPIQVMANSSSTPDYVELQINQRPWSFDAQGGMVSSTTLATRTIGLADLNGDGFPDFRDQFGSALYMGTGTRFMDPLDYHGFAGFEIVSGAMNYLDTSATPDKWRFGSVAGLLDLNGDGQPEWVTTAMGTPPTAQSFDPTLAQWHNCAWGGLLYCGPEEFSALHRTAETLTFVKNLGTSFGSIRQWTGVAAGSGFSYVAGTSEFRHSQFYDFDATGTPDLVIYDGTSTRVHRNNEVKPDLLTAIKYGTGGSVAIGYTPIVSGMAGVGGNLKGPRIVVSMARTSDGLGNSVRSSYSYSDPYFDRARRQFLGFGKVSTTTTDFDAVASPFDPMGEVIYANGDPNRLIADTASGRATGEPTYTTSETFRDGFELAGRPFFSRSGGSRSNPALRTMNTQTLTRWKVVSAGVVKAVVKEFERKVDVDPDLPSSNRWSQRNYEYDAYGNPTKVLDYGETRFSTTQGCYSQVNWPNETICPIDATYQEVERYTLTAYARNTEAWIFSPSESSTCADATCSTTPLAQSQVHYDGLALSQVARGDVTMAKTWVEGATWSTTSNLYDPNGNVTQTTSPTGAITSYGWLESAAFKKDASLTVSLGKPVPIQLNTSYVWDERFGVMTRTIDDNKRTEQNMLDGLGRVVSTWSSPADDASGALVKLSEIEYHLGGVVASPQGSQNYTKLRTFFGIGPSDYFDAYSYSDGVGRVVLTKSQTYDSGTTKWITVNQRHGIHDVDRRTLPYYTSTPNYSAFDFQAPIPSQAVQKTTFDHLGRITQTSLQSTTGNERYFVSTVYRDHLWDHRIIDPLAYGKRYTSNAHSHVVKVEEMDGTVVKATTVSEYDRLGRLASVTDAAANLISAMTYDGAGNRRTLVDADASNCGTLSNCPWKHSYNLSGQLTNQVDAKGQSISYLVDEVGRLYSKDYAAVSEADITHTYDEGANAAGRLVSTTQGSDAVAYGYDNWGRVIAVTKTIAGVTKTTTLTYDLAGNQLQMSYPNGDRVVYFHTPDGRIARVVHYLPGGAAKEIVSSSAFDARGRQTLMVWGSGVKTLSTYDGEFQKISSRRVETGAGVPLSVMTYTYHDDGNINVISELLPGKEWRRSHLYDWGNRLVSASHFTYQSTWVLQKSWTYRYDAIGNMIYNSAYDTGGAMDGTFVYGNGAGPHALTRVGNTTSTYQIHYDRNGAAISNGGRIYSYNADGRVTAAQGAGTASATLSYLDGERTRKQSKDLAQNTWDIRTFGAHYEEAIRNGQASADRYVVVGGQRVAHLSDAHAGTIYFLHPDMAGTVGLLTDLNGVSVSRKVFAPFGELMSDDVPAAGNDPSLRYGYTGQEHDSEIDQLHLGVRQHDPKLARFLVPDNMIPDASNPQSHNRYSYGLNNPVRFTDVTGYAPGDPWESDDGSSSEGITLMNNDGTFTMVIWASRLQDEGPGDAELDSDAGAPAPLHTIWVDDHGWVPTTLETAFQERRDSDPLYNALAFYLPTDIRHADSVALAKEKRLEELHAANPGFCYECAVFAHGSVTLPADLMNSAIGVAGNVGVRPPPPTGPPYTGRPGPSRPAGDINYLYQKVGPKGEHLKFGITNNPARRYTAADLKGGKLRIVAQGPKARMLSLERDVHSTLPIGPEEGQIVYIQIQVDKGLKRPPYK